MGQSSSRSRRRDEDRQSYPRPAPFFPPPPLSSTRNTSSQPYFSTPYYNPPPTTPFPYYYAYQQPPSSNYNGLMGFFQSWLTNSFPSFYRSNQGNVSWNSAVPPPPAAIPPYSSFSEASSSSTVVTPPPYVDHQKAKTIKNDVNLHKDMIRLEVDVQNPEEYLVSFVYDAVVDGSITIYYFAKEGANCSFSSTEEDIYKPRNYLFEKGKAKNFCQPSGHGIDLGFFELESLSKPVNGEAFPLVIYAKACGPTAEDGQSSQSSASHVQITLAIIEKNSKGEFEAKVIKQILWIAGERYELQEIFGLDNSSSEQIDDGDDDIGKECVICLTEPRNTAVFPCRHLCMCSDCAKSLRVKSNKCPICRQPVEKLMEINVNLRSSNM
ncbi:probable E3 ubiquitin-protein ligase LUL2 [Phalaenopsis equestris]|uniref:probable E3 ubiquitin-protein ligase LUL2 n=1 Tax=Phalaenopsis equestris TaxID=78828 RepID=UPI0009E37F33|nr:probable E3 ubiquitin-protein ligase LUL2 [Phalaenopsis equestris]